MSRVLLRSVLELRTPITRLPPTFLLPIRTAPAAASVRFLNQQTSRPTGDNSLPPTSILQSSQKSQQPPPPTTSTTTPIEDSVRTLLPLLAAQPNHYLTIHIHGKPYLVTEGDSVRLPFKMPGVQPGDILRLNRASVVGSRDYTLQGAPYVDERLFECRAVVTGTEAEPMRSIVKKKRRCRRKKTVTSKHRFTMLRISEVRICDGVELD